MTVEWGDSSGTRRRSNVVVFSGDAGQDIAAQMTVSELVDVCEGDDQSEFETWGQKGGGRFDLPLVRHHDGPLGVSASTEQTAFPATIAAAASFDTDLAYQQGTAMGRETKAADGQILLGPGLNLVRNPKCGRNFEYFTEDPFLNGEMAASVTQGIQSENVVATPKHYTANHQETDRQNVNAIVSERALRELYLPGFRKAIQEGGALSIMTAFNAVNGDNCTENRWLLKHVLRHDWAFDGFVMTDWDAMDDAVGAALAGTDLDMPGDNLYNADLANAVQSRDVPESYIEDMAANVIGVLDEIGHLDGGLGPGEDNTQEHQNLSRDIAEAGAVLLKNDGTLPVDPGSVSSIAVCGSTANQAIVGGGGSSDVNAPSGATIDALTGIENYVGSDATVNHYPSDATQASADDVAFAFGHVDSGEYNDRSDLSLDSGDTAIQDAANNNANTIAVLRVPGPVEMPWLADVAGVICLWYPGMRDGEATANLLFGDSNPSGKLPVTFAQDSQYPTSVESSTTDINYDEELSVGYRHFDDVADTPTFAFGFGMSYTSFSYANFSAPSTLDLGAGETATVSVDVTNDGSVAGEEVVQFYVSQANPTVTRPPKELKGFDKVAVDPGQTVTATAELDREAFRFWDPNSEDWTVEADDFDVHFAAAADDIKSTSTISVSV